ncbi:unnamed protein product [Brachionus calyciflorus]|uniref:Uncharacterized protein n=1 Tax=Brachionus calyciflorus TaxID=104777 RepID=A0A813WWV6_9BILA|nr:unnamed protein product [Brachionus calyciflorus]
MASQNQTNTTEQTPEKEINYHEIKQRLFLTFLLIFSSAFQFSFNVNSYNNSYKNEFNLTNKHSYNIVFFLGAIIGTLLTFKILDHKMNYGIWITSLLTIVASIFSLVSFNPEYRELIILISRFIFGIQGGLSLCLIPFYLIQITPILYPGHATMAKQLAFIIGILIPRLTEFSNSKLSKLSLGIIFAFPIVPAILILYILRYFKRKQIQLDII